MKHKSPVGLSHRYHTTKGEAAGTTPSVAIPQGVVLLPTHHLDTQQYYCVCTDPRSGAPYIYFMGGLVTNRGNCCWTERLLTQETM